MSSSCSTIHVLRVTAAAGCSFSYPIGVSEEQHFVKQIMSSDGRIFGFFTLWLSTTLGLLLEKPCP